MTPVKAGQEGIIMAKWLDNAVFYEIYPQSFQDSNGDGIGDFRGIIQIGRASCRERVYLLV